MNEPLIRVGLVTASVLFALAIAEIAVRVLDVPPKMLEALNSDAFILSANPILKFEFKPGYEVGVPVRHRGVAWFKINSSGFRDHEFPLAKDEHVTRIISLGDSVTAGHGIKDIEQIYPRVLEDLLNQSGNHGRFEILNMGVNGYSTLQEVVTLEEKGIGLKPDIVMIGFCLNDFTSSEGGAFSLLSARAGNQYLNINYRLARLRSLNYVVRKSRLAFVLYHRLSALIDSLGESELTRSGDIYTTDHRSVRRGMEMLSELKKRHDFDVYIFVIPVFDGLFSKYRRTEYHQEVKSIVADFPEFTLFDLKNDFSEIGPDGSVFSHDGLHPNAYGHRTLAEIMSDKILKDLSNGEEAP
jgi:lysophospholipase L1-like esterase